MKDIAEVVCCVVDYGKFTFVAEKMAEKCFKTYYHTPVNREFFELNDHVKGDGMAEVYRLDEFLDPDKINEIDLFIFPDIGFGAEQRLLRHLGKAVWGSMGAYELELSRTRFIKTISELGLPLVPSKSIQGISKLAEYLKENDDKWIKINKFRAAMETWHHQDFRHSAQKLDSLAVKFGPLKDKVMFVVQDPIDADVEIGYDGWTVGGAYPESTFQGYELKNELYLGSHLLNTELPEQVREVNEAMAPVLSEWGYQNFIATEIRIKDGVGYYIDPTHRMPGLTGDQLPETCSNFAEVIWSGANGILIKPEFICKFAAVGTLHYKGHTAHEWFSLNIPEEVRRWFKLYHFCKADGMYCFVPSVPFECDEPGTVLGIGDSIVEAIDHLKENLEAVEGEPITCEVGGFKDLLEQVQEAEEQGVEFTDEEVPEPAIVIEG
jgi:hypothetical protein